LTGTVISSHCRRYLLFSINYVDPADLFSVLFWTSAFMALSKYNMKRTLMVEGTIPKSVKCERQTKGGGSILLPGEYGKGWSLFLR
jgi:hypothetical protein